MKVYVVIQHDSNEGENVDGLGVFQDRATAEKCVVETYLDYCENISDEDIESETDLDPIKMQNFLANQDCYVNIFIEEHELQ